MSSEHWLSFWIGIAGSVVASLILLLTTVLYALWIRRLNSERFVGSFVMLNGQTRKPHSGRVTIEHDLTKRLLSTGTTAVLSVYAEHQGGTEDWTASLEVEAGSSLAVGFFTYRQVHDGGFLRLVLSADGSEITEHATPHKSDPFTMILRRIRTEKRR